MVNSLSNVWNELPENIRSESNLHISKASYQPGMGRRVNVQLVQNLTVYLLYLVQFCYT
jgi:hypothetical protein